MHLSSKQLQHLTVKTQSNVFLGYIIGFEMDTIEQKIINYYVKKGVFANPLLQQLTTADHIIHQSQVLSITSERMLVEDAAVREEMLAKAEERPAFSEEETA